MYEYQHEELNELITRIIRDNVESETFSWMEEAARNNTRFNTAFVSMPRKTGKQPIQLEPATSTGISKARPGFNIEHWTIDRLARVWLIMQLDPLERDEYFRRIENLFQAAEVNELVALYSALPVLAYPAMWKARCAEGIRNNIGDVLTAIMCKNPYPSEYLDEAAWNQLVLKAIFTDKPMNEVIGIDKRSNLTLARTLSDYAHERWAAHRSVNPQLWRCVGPFINENILPDIHKIAGSENPAEQEAAALAVYMSNYAPAKDLMSVQHKKMIEAGELTWNSIEAKTKNHVLQ